MREASHRCECYRAGFFILKIDRLDAQLYWKQPELETHILHPQVICSDLFSFLKTAQSTGQATKQLIKPTQPLAFSVLRLDLLHPFISGNKWPKMRAWWHDHLLLRPEQQAVTMGGSHSNHLLAFAAVGYELGVPVRCYVRADGQGNELSRTPTLKLIQNFGAEILPVSRTEFRQLRETHKEPRFLPEGGQSALGVESVAQWVYHHRALFAVDETFLGCGTGTFLAGLVKGLKGDLESNLAITGVPAVAGQHWLEQDIKTMINTTMDITAPWSLDWRYPQRKFGPVDARVFRLFSNVVPLPLDPVYLPRVFFLLFCRWTQGSLPSKTLVIHGGGLR